MKKALLFALILIPALAWPEKPKANPADFTIDVHVQSSRTMARCNSATPYAGSCGEYQQLSVIIDGKEYELEGNYMPRKAYVLHVGDYKAKVLKEDTSLSYGDRRTYQFIFPDGQTAEYLLTGESD